jgi:hypothetical protein
MSTWSDKSNCRGKFYHRAVQDANTQRLAQLRWQWDGKAYLEVEKTFLGDYLKTPLPASMWKAMK